MGSGLPTDGRSLPADEGVNENAMTIRNPPGHVNAPGRGSQMLYV